MMSGSKGLFASLDMAKYTNAYSDAQGAPLSPNHVSLEAMASNDTLVSAPQRITHNLFVHYAISKL